MKAELQHRRATGYYRPDPEALPASDVLTVPSIVEVLDACEVFNEAHADDGVGSEAADGHLDPHWLIYSLLAAVKELNTMNQRLVNTWEAGYAEGLRVCKFGKPV